MAINILVVDDSASIRIFVKKTLSMLDMDFGDIHEAGNGKEALAVLETHGVDLILTDINMPVMNGLEFTRSVRAQNKYDHIKIVVISTEGSKEMILETVKAGANSYLKKPFGPEEALNILEEATK